MEEITYRKLELKDVPTFIELRITQLLEEGAVESIDLQPALKIYYEKHLSQETFVSWIALHGKTIIATSGLSINERPPYFNNPSGKVGVLSSMYTLKKFRRQGIATQLLKHIVEEGKVHGCDLIQITASDEGTLLYDSFGFTTNRNFRQYKLQ